MKRLTLIFVALLIVSSCSVFCQEEFVNTGGFYFGIDIGRGREPLSYESFEGTMFHYPKDPSHQNFWVTSFQPEGKPRLSFGGKIGMVFSKQTSSIQLSGEVGMEFFSIGYPYKNFDSYGNQAYLNEFDYVLSSINLIPKLKVSSPITSSLRGYIGLGIGLSLLKLNEKENGWTYYGDLDLEYSVRFDETANVTTPNLNTCLGIEWSISPVITTYFEYDYLYIPKIEFEFDEITKSGKVENSRGSIEWSITNGKRERHFYIPSTNLKFGINIYL
ncbi:MAG: hypothetical protein C0410_15750 [Anaerolinea sp.]|nr:hypothetical protein [Anaerolinea sp.]